MSKKIKIIIFILLLILFIYPHIGTNANGQKAFIDNGKIIFETTDAKATTNIKWKTVGFTICREKTYGNPNTSKNKAVIMLEEGWKKETTKDNKVKVVFTVPEDEVSIALKNAGLSEIIKDGDILYLNGIFRIVEGGTDVKGEEYNTLQSIKKARPWKTLSDFPQHFDVEVVYKSSNKLIPASIEYEKYENGEFIKTGTKSLGRHKVFTKIKANEEIIPNSRDGYDLFRVYYIINNKPKVKIGDRKTSINPNFFSKDYIKDLKFIRDREFVVEASGIKIVAIYRKFPKKENEENSEVIFQGLHEPEIVGIIDSDFYKKEKFNVNEGIPTNETLYTNVIADDYLLTYKFVRKYGKKHYNINVSKNVTIKYKEKDEKTGKIIEKVENRNIIKSYQIPREYSYWIIEDFTLYSIHEAVIETDVLDGKVIMAPTNYIIPNVSYIKYSKENEHIIEPTISNLVLPSSTYYQENFPDFNFKEIAEASIDEIICKNDKLIFNNQEIMSNESRKIKTKKPGLLEINAKPIEEECLFKNNLLIAKSKKNGEYISKGRLVYRPHLSINNRKDIIYNIDINNVIVHNPVICDGMVENKFKYNQRIFPEVGIASLILEMPFKVALSSYGKHNDYKGYGTKDYSKYISQKEIRFPFDVYEGNSDKGKYIKKYTWININNTSEYFLPFWIDEGNYTIDFRSVGQNSITNEEYNNIEEYANLNINNYVAIDKVNVNVSGRVYNFQLYDVSDYPLWENVFRMGKGSTKLSGYNYKVDSLPLVDGSHPEYKQLGSVKLGYYTRFSLTTAGNMDGSDDYIRIIPKFYHIDKDGSNRQEVDIYYSETINDIKQTMIKMGSELDLNNKKMIKTGDLYMAINEQELYQTAVLTNMSLDKLKNQSRNVYTFTNIMIPPSLRTYVGYIKDIPPSINKDKVAKSKQNWYGEYYLPSRIYITPMNFNLEGYIKQKGYIDFKEKFWLKEGYLIVNFNIETIINGKRYLSYINEINSKYGYCNMWKEEGYRYNIIDIHNNKHVFQDGDYVLYNIEKSATIDWKSAGTH